MTAARSSRRRTSRRAARTRKPVARRAAKPAVRRAVKPAVKLKASAKVAAPQVHYRLCRSGWAVIVETQPNAQGTRFVCPFCPMSHRVSGPVRGFKRVRRAQWMKLRRVEG
jgi:hypothetical protein